MIVKPPIYRHRAVHDRKPTVFLAGSIEMGRATDWQSDFGERLQDRFSVIYNPRRDDWDSSWRQERENPDFNGQVTWELNFIEKADYVLFHFEAGTISPVSLLELGLCLASKPLRTFVSCPHGFHRKGNVEITCDRYGVNTYESLDSAVYELAKVAENFKR